jgi:hypothetical protein
LSSFDDLEYQGDLDLSTYPGSEKEAAIEKSILDGTAFGDPSEIPVIEIDRGSTGISQGNHRTYSMRKLRDEGKIGNIMVPMNIIYYGNKDLDPRSWYP